MASNQGSGMTALTQFLYANRLPIYIGGLIAILIPRGLRTFTDIRLAPETRTVIVVVTLLFMILTYLAERRVRGRDDGGSHEDREYDLAVRLAVGMAVIGVAVGIYVTLEVNTLVGILFIIGSYLFGAMAFRRDRGNGNQPTDTGIGE
ncbi:MAG: hypothetical protein SVG88_04025 [Halobacteriales archaeon]|nr:hypothetical protein [Halobacteriales archaeon]